MKKTILGRVMLLLVAVMAFAACKKEIPTIDVTGVSIEKDSIVLDLKQSEVLKAMVLPESATDKSVVWTSSKESVATISAEGEVKAIAVGEAMIVVTSKNGAYKDSCKVRVFDGSIVYVKSVDIADSLTLKLEESSMLNATILPADATNKAIVWASSNEAVASVSAEGEVKAIGIGEAKIVVTTDDGSFSDTCIVAVISNKNLVKKREILTYGYVYEFTYDAEGRPTECTYFTSADPDKFRVVYEYSENEITATTKARKPTDKDQTYTFKLENNLVVQINAPDGFMKDKYEYDEDGRITRYNGYLDKLSFTWDENNIVSKTYPWNEVSPYTYTSLENNFNFGNIKDGRMSTNILHPLLDVCFGVKSKNLLSGYTDRYSGAIEITYTLDGEGRVVEMLENGVVVEKYTY